MSEIKEKVIYLHCDDKKAETKAKADILLGGIDNFVDDLVKGKYDERLKEIRKESNE